jgi:crotonobetainyl-CoA:carnitine CoA-transferase CaiB-like acyl-CoA transferase
MTLVLLVFAPIGAASRLSLITGGQMSEMPLSGLTVLELGHSIAAPYAGLVLAELGAEVIKVERTGVGDPVRDWGPPYTDGIATAFQTYNRSKAGIEIDLRDDQQRAALQKLIIDRGDIVLQNLKAGAADRAGLGGKQLTELKPSLIYCNLHAFGAVGPLKDRPGYDPLMQAFGGLMSVTGEPGERPPVRIGVSIIDMGAGMWAVIGILAALAELRRSGRGSIVDVSLFETAIGWMMWPLSSYLATGQIPGRQGSSMSTIVPYQVFPTLDSNIMIAAGNDNLFNKLCRALGRTDLACDERFATNGGRVRFRDILLPVLEEIFATRSTAEWSELLAREQVPAAPLQNVADVAAAEQTRALNMLRAEVGLSHPYVALPISFDGVRPRSKNPAPALGADTDRILRKTTV